MGNRFAPRVARRAFVIGICALTQPRMLAQTQTSSTPGQRPGDAAWQYGGFLDASHLHDFNAHSNHLIGYDGLYAKDNFAYTRPWGADYTPYLMLGVNAGYAVTKNLTATVAMTNGYWHLAHANDVPSVGGQLAYKASDRASVKETVLYGPHQPNTSLEFWRVLSDSIVECKGDRVTTAFEFQLGAERVDEPAMPQALWMSAQLPIHWAVHGPWSVT